MASYPGAVKTFAVRANGQTIQDTWFNDLQDEVTALEDGILNGTAPLTSSRITGASLQVSGGSTLASLSVTGNSTLAAVTQGASTLASLSVSGGSTFAGPVVMATNDAARLELAADQQIASGSSAAISWTSQVAVTNSSMHSTASNPSQVLFQSTGLYWCHAQVTFGIATSTVYAVYVKDSSNARIAANIQRSRSSGVDDTFILSASGLKYVDTVSANPFAKVSVTAIGSTNRVIATASQTHFDVIKLR